MTRYRPNEPTCPVPLDALALLLRSDEARVAALADELPEAQRVALALYCFSRYHMRRLAFAVAQRCSKRALEGIGGVAGRQLFDHAIYAEVFDIDPANRHKRKITLAKFAA